MLDHSKRIGEDKKNDGASRETRTRHINHLSGAPTLEDDEGYSAHNHHHRDDVEDESLAPR